MPARVAAEPRVTLFCASPERAAAVADAALLDALGLSTAILELGNAAPPDGVGVVYLSGAESGRILPGGHEAASKGHGPGLIAVLVGESELGSRQPETAFATVLKRPAAAVASGAFARQLRAAVLEALDSQGAGRLADTADETHFLPGSLTVSWQGGSVVIPADFEGLVTVGRSATCQVTVDSSFASRLHGCIRSAGDGWLYRDMSRNGTVLYDGHEEVLIQDAECEIRDGVELKIGDQCLRLSRNPG